MKKEDFDVVIIGAGMGGLITGAILAKRSRMKVLVVEKESQIGGRVMSFGGPHGDFSKEEYTKLLGGASGCWVVDADPGIDKIIEDGLFRNHIVDCGWHGMSAGDRCRYAVMARSLGNKRLHVSPQVGFLYYRDGGWIELKDLARGWSKGSHNERSRIAFERQLMGMEEAKEFYDVDVREFLKSKTDDPLVQEYYETMAKFQFGINDLTRISAGEWIMCNNMTSQTGRDLSTGGGMGDVSGGFKMVANVFAEILLENGGEIRTSNQVKEVIIKDHQVKSVVVENEKGESEQIEVKRLVSSIPLNRIFPLIPEEHFPDEMVKTIKNIYPMPGLLGHIKLKGKIEHEWDKAMFVLNELPGIELRGGRPVYGFEQTSVIDPSRILRDDDGVYLQSWVGVSASDPDEVHDLPLMKELWKKMMDFMRQHYPDFDNMVEWAFCVAAGALYGINPGPGMVGDHRPAVKNPLINNMFFTGDTVTQFDVGSSGAAHGAVHCANAVSGQDHLVLLPSYMR